MKKNSVFGAVSFRYVLLDHYKKLGISEMELVVLLMFDHLMEQGNEVPTADMMSLKMNLSPAEIDGILADLYRRGLISFDTKTSRFSLDPLMEKLSGAFAKSMTYEKEKRLNEEREERLAGLYEFIESRWERTLTPIEKATVSDWVDANYSDKEIHSAVRDGLNQNKVNVRYVGQRLRAIRRVDDIAEEGYSAVDENWNTPIGESLEQSQKKWEDED